MIWIDVLILAIIGYFALRGFTQGIISIIIELAGYVFAYIISLRYAYLGVSLIDRYAPFQLPKAYEETVGVAIVWTFAMFAYYILAPFVMRMVPPFLSHSLLNRVGGVVGSSLKGFILVSLALFIINLLPMPSDFRSTLDSSILAPRIIALSNSVAQRFGNQELFSSINDTLKQITLIGNDVNGGGDTKTFLLKGKTDQTTIDTQDEQDMLTFVNDQRTKNHVKPLTLNTTLTQVARAYGEYMFSQGYLSHISPDGKSPYDRVSQAHVAFVYVGENIANAANLDLADQGLMNSPEHKKNILDPDYDQIGIGAIDGGPQLGKIYVQDFIGTKY